MTGTAGQTAAATASITAADQADPDSGNNTTSVQVTLADVPLTAAGASPSVFVNSPFTVTVATFTDADPFAVASYYTATITWGDGSTSPGTVTANGQGGFNVAGSHEFTVEGYHSITIQIVDVGGSMATVTSNLRLPAGG